MLNKIKMTVVSVSQKNIRQAVRILGEGGVVVAPTDSVYGLFGDALNESTVRRIRGMKGRDGVKPFQIAVSKEDAGCYGKLNKNALKIIKKYWPGDVNIIVEKKPVVPDYVSEKTVCITCHKNPVAAALVRGVGPLISTSVNLAGMPPATRVGEIAPELLEEVDLALDGGETKNKMPNTIVDATKNPLQVVREGVVKKQELGDLITISQ